MLVKVKETPTGYAVRICDLRGNTINEVYFYDGGTAKGVVRAWVSAQEYAGRVQRHIQEIN